MIYCMDIVNPLTAVPSTPSPCTIDIQSSQDSDSHRDLARLTSHTLQRLVVMSMYCTTARLSPHSPTASTAPCFYPLRRLECLRPPFRLNAHPPISCAPYSSTTPPAPGRPHDAVRTPPSRPSVRLILPFGTTFTRRLLISNPPLSVSQFDPAKANRQQPDELE